MLCSTSAGKGGVADAGAELGKFSRTGFKLDCGRCCGERRAVFEPEAPTVELNACSIMIIVRYEASVRHGLLHQTNAFYQILPQTHPLES